MKKMLLVVSMVFAFTVSAAQAQITLMDQIGVTPVTLRVSYVAPLARSRISQLPHRSGDNFSVPAGGAVRLTSVQGVMMVSNEFTGAHYNDGILTQWAVEIYSSTAAATANLTGRRFPHGVRV